MNNVIIIYIMGVFKLEDSSSQQDVIGEGCYFNGSIESKNSIEINGTYVGDVIKAEKVVITKTGSVESDIFTKVLVLEGVMVGDVKQANRVILASSGKLLGNINAKELVTSEGVMIKGSFKISSKDQNNIENEIRKINASRHPKEENAKPSKANS